MRATNMLVCGEDLGFLAPCVHPLMKALGLIGEPSTPLPSKTLVCLLSVSLPWQAKQSEPLIWLVFTGQLCNCLPEACAGGGRPPNSTHAVRAEYRIWRPSQLPLYVRGVPLLPRHLHHSGLVRGGRCQAAALLRTSPSFHPHYYCTCA